MVTLGVMLISLLFTSSALGSTLMVGEGGDFMTIAGAIDASMDGDTIEVGPGTYPELIEPNGKAITIRATAGPTDTIITGNGTGTIWLNNGETSETVISGFTVQGDGHTCIYIAGGSPHLENLVVDGCGADDGVYGGGAQVIAADPTFRAVTFQNNRAEEAGALYSSDSSDIRIEDGIFSANHAQYGGALSAVDSVLILVSTHFEFNQAEFGQAGALYLQNSVVDIEASHFDTNQATLAGGAVLADLGSLNISSMSTFTSNSSSFGDGGALRLTRLSSLSISDTDFTSNSAGGSGGAASLSDITGAEISYALLSDNRSGVGGHGGALSLEYTGATINTCTLDSNQSDNSGGAIRLASSDLIASDLTISGNQSSNIGGGIAAQGGSLHISATEFQRNVGVAGGGAISTAAIETTVTSTRFEDNESTGGNGGALLLSGVEATLS